MPERPSLGAARRLATLVGWTSSLALVALLVLEGWELVHTPALRLGLLGLVLLSIVLSTWQDALRLYTGPQRLRLLARVAPETGLLLLLVLALDRPALWAALAFARQSIVVARLATGTHRYRSFMESLQARPAQMLALSFVAIIGGGALLLTFPRATTDGLGAGWVDALFTATSATCVTGLATLNTVADAFADPSRQTFSPFGQAVILLLIQVGALGIMTLSAATIILAGRRLSLRSASLMQEILDESSTSALKAAIRSIFLMTFIVELLGAIALYPRFAELTDSSLYAVWLSVFHAISAFCNAGFSLFGDSLASHRGDLWINVVHAVLIILGGLGFTAISALVAPRTWRHGSSGFWRSLPLQARLALIMTAILLTTGTILFFFFEFDHSLRGLPVREKLIASAFQSVSFRTAGFNTVDMAALSRPMVLIACLLMFIGASPGSTAGGVKTTTVAVLFMSIPRLPHGPRPRRDEPPHHPQRRRDPRRVHRHHGRRRPRRRPHRAADDPAAPRLRAPPLRDRQRARHGWPLHGRDPAAHRPRQAHPRLPHVRRPPRPPHGRPRRRPRGRSGLSELPLRRRQGHRRLTAPPPRGAPHSQGDPR
jgi:trk system potassium uptake protein TrkH